MKKIMFNDKYGLTKAVLEGRKSQTRRFIKLNANQYVRVVALDNGSFFSYVAEPGKPSAFMGELELPEYDGELSPAYFIGEEVAVAQSYFDTEILHDGGFSNIGQTSRLLAQSGAKNKMFVKADLMPHRIKITNIRIERLQDISDEECLKEGIYLDYSDRDWDEGDDPAVCYRCTGIPEKEFGWPQKAFAYLIDKVSGKGTWDSNPYVFVYDFELLK